MLTDPKLKSQVDQLWNKLWSGGLTNPLDAVEQLSYLIFFKRLEVTEVNIRKAYGLRVGSLLEIDGIPDCQAIVQRQFDGYIARHDAFNADQVRFLRAVQSVFVQKRRLARIDLYQAPLDAFGQDAVDRLFAPAEVAEVLELARGLAIS